MTVPYGPLAAILCAQSSAFAADLARAEAGEKVDVVHTIDGRETTIKSRPDLASKEHPAMYDISVKLDTHGDLSLFGSRLESGYTEGALMATPQGRDATAFLDKAEEREGEAFGDLLPADGVFAPLGAELISYVDYEPPMGGSDLHMVTTHWQDGPFVAA